MLRLRNVPINAYIYLTGVFGSDSYQDGEDNPTTWLLVWLVNLESMIFKQYS